MKCTICGYESEATAACPYCGHPLDGQKTVSDSVRDHGKEPFDSAQEQGRKAISEEKATVICEQNERGQTPHPPHFGAGKVVLTVFLSIFAGLLIVVATCTLLMAINPFHINDLVDAFSHEERDFRYDWDWDYGNPYEHGYDWYSDFDDWY